MCLRVACLQDMDALELPRTHKIVLAWVGHIHPQQGRISLELLVVQLTHAAALPCSAAHSSCCRREPK